MVVKTATWLFFMEKFYSAWAIYSHSLTQCRNTRWCRINTVIDGCWEVHILVNEKVRHTHMKKLMVEHPDWDWDYWVAQFE